MKYNSVSDFSGEYTAPMVEVVTLTTDSLMMNESQINDYAENIIL